jgi:hypothetical protein
MNEYLIKVTTKQSLNTVKKHIEKKFKTRDGAYDKAKDEYIGATYVYQLPERGADMQHLNKNIECLRDRLNDISRQTDYINFYDGDNNEATIRLTNKWDANELPNLLLNNKLNGCDNITMYEKGFEFTIKDYSIELIND